MAYLFTGKNRLYYESKIINSQFDTFIFLHGLGGSVEQTKSTFTEVPSNLNMIYLDLRGNGESDIGDINELSFNVLADDVKKLCDYLKLRKIIIGGISMGAGVSTSFAIRYPEYVKKLILIRIAWLDRRMDDNLLKSFKYIVELIKNFDINEAKKIFMSGEDYKEKNEKYPYNAKSDKTCFEYKYAKQTVDKYIVMPMDYPIDNIKDLSKINIPTLILANQFDPVHPFSYGEIYHENIKTSILKEIPSKNIDYTNHYVMINKFINDFIKL